MKRADLAKPMLKNNQEGFTLVEIIAVLVILGILAAVAVPKYFSLQSEAKNKAAEGALAEGVSRINQHFALQLLGGSAFNDINYDEARVGTNMGDFILSILGTSGGPSADVDISIAVNGRSGTAVVGARAARLIPRPGKAGGP